MLVCINCGKPLMEVPLYNNAQDNEYPPAFLFCNFEKCGRFGLLTVTFKNEEEDTEGGDKEVQQESVPATD